MDDVTLLIEYDQHREAKTSCIVEPLHQRLAHFTRLTGMVIGMDIDKVLLNDAVDGAVTGDELALGLSTGDGLVNLFQRVDTLVIHLLERRLLLGISHHGKKCDGKH